MAKNFKGATYSKNHHYNSNNFYLEVLIECANIGWVSDEICCGNGIKEDTLEEIKEKVVERIEYLKNKIESQKHQLTIIDSIYKEFKQSYHDMCTRLKDACGTNQYGYINSIGNAIYQDIVGSDIF